MDLLQGGVVHISSIWGTFLGGCIHWFGEIFQCGGRGVTKTMGSILFGVELSDVCPEVSNASQDRSALTSMVMLICPSALSGGALMGLAVGMGIE